MAYQRALGDLEQVRDLLNSWRSGTRSRIADDRFGQVIARLHLHPEEAEDIKRFRDELRSVVEGDPRLDAVVNWWLRRTHLRITVQGGSVSFGPEATVLQRLVAGVVRSIGAETWSRLKACPSCRWIFVDRSRNASRVWCTMSAGNDPDGRSCGSIAKVERWRERQQPAQAPGQA